MKTLFKEFTLFKIVSLIMIALFTTPVWAMDLHSAKEAGLVGEQANGYLGIVTKPAGNDVKDLIKDINSKRKAKYMEIAKQKQVELKVVEKRAGAKVIEKTRAGQYINTGNTWQKK